MADDHGLSDLRFEGYSNDKLAGQVDGLRNGVGAQSLHDAARALVTLAGALSDTDGALGQARTLPVPPGMDLVAQPVDNSTHVSSVGGPSVGGGDFVPGGSAQPGSPGGAPGGPGGSGPYLPGTPGAPGAPGTPGGPGGGLPGNNAGVGPVPPLLEGMPGAAGGPGGRPPPG